MSRSNVFEIPIEEFNRAECVIACSQIMAWASEWGWHTSEGNPDVSGQETAKETYDRVIERMKILGMEIVE